MKTETYDKFSAIPRFPQSSYTISVRMSYIQSALDDWTNEMGLQLDPDFQRCHVWTEAQSISYVEYILRGGESGRTILFNHNNWVNADPPNDDFVLVDGKQRLNAISLFMNNKIKVFGNYKDDFTDGMISSDYRMEFQVLTLPTRKEVLSYYISLNRGGTPHSDDEINKVNKMLSELSHA